MFKKIFIDLCNKNGETPSAVCRKVNITPATFSCWTDESVPRRATLQRIADYFGVTTDYLIGKEQKPNKKPSNLVKTPKAVRIPVYGNVAAGIPLEAITDIDEWEEIPEDVAATGEYIALRINGDSMEPRMSRGDVVIVRLQPDVENGDMAIALINGGEATCKKIQKTPDGILLMSINTAYAPMFYSNKQIEELPVRFLGKVVELRAKF